MEYLKSLSAKYENPETDENARYYYMLLKVKAANNAYKPLNDSTIFHVFNFFKTTADKEKLCQSYYYVGKYYVQNNDAPQALENFQKSLDLTDESTPLYFRSCIYNQTGRLLYFQSMFDEALDMYQRSYKCDSIIGDTISVLYSMRDIATIYNFKNDFRKCLTLLGKAYKLSKHTNDKGLTNSISQSLAICYFDTGDLAKSKYYLMETLAGIDPDVKSSAYSLAIDLYNKENKKDSVFYFSQKLLDIGTVFTKQKASSTLCTYFFDKNDISTAQKYLEQSILLNDSINKIKALDVVAKMHFVYNFNKAERENIQLKAEVQENVYINIIIILSIVSLACFFIFINERNKKKMLQLRMLNEHLEILLNDANSQNAIEIETHRHDNEEYQAKIIALNKRNSNERDEYEYKISQMQNHINELKEMTSQNSDGQNLYSISDIYILIKNRLKEKKNISGKDWEQIEYIFNMLYPCFKERLLKKYNIGNEDLKICMLVKLNFTNVDISGIMNRTPSAISMKRANLYQKITKSDGSAKDFNDFIKSI